jgi:hypothetical protein
MTEGQIVERAAALSWPLAVTGGNTVLGEVSWRRAAALPGCRAELAAQLDQHEAAAARARAREAQHAAQDADRAARRDPPMLTTAERNQDALEREAEFQRHEAERPRRIEAKLDEIAELLRGMAKR